MHRNHNINHSFISWTTVNENRCNEAAIGPQDIVYENTGVNPAGDAGDTSPPPIFWLGDVNGNIPPILLRTFGYSRPILVALRWLSLKSISFGYKTPPIRFSQAGGQSPFGGSSPQPWTRVDATVWKCRERQLTEVGGMRSEARAYRNRSDRPGGCRDNNLTSNKNFYVHVISTFVNVKWTKTQVEKNACTVVSWFSGKLVNLMPQDIKF